MPMPRSPRRPSAALHQALRLSGAHLGRAQLLGDLGLLLRRLRLREPRQLVLGLGLALPRGDRLRPRLLGLEPELVELRLRLRHPAPRLLHLLRGLGLHLALPVLELEGAELRGALLLQGVVSRGLPLLRGLLRGGLGLPRAPLPLLRLQDLLGLRLGQLLRGPRLLLRAPAPPLRLRGVCPRGVEGRAALALQLLEPVLHAGGLPQA
mmetsp:Transcript_84495/g.247845  ORF Transcript_84495/g.247845 Transcript_84495/m.247845 type:complete len:208 (-) Transcript_84495:226-849(-)